MKKILSMLLVLSMLLGCSVAMAEMGVQVIGGPGSGSAEPLNFDDIKLGNEYKIDGYATITPLSFEFVDYCSFFSEGHATKNVGDTYSPQYHRELVYLEPVEDGKNHKKYYRNYEIGRASCRERV